MKREKRLAVFCVVCVVMWALGFSISAQGAVVYVTTDGNDASDGLSWATAKRTVQAGLNTASSGDEVWVAKGTYIGRIILKDGVKLYGGFTGTETSLAERPSFPRPSPDPNETVLDGNKSVNVVTAPSTMTSGVTIDGFTIRNGKAANGAGIYCLSSYLTISNNTITGNNASSYGGGIYCYNASPTISNNAITNNNALPYGNGGGIYCQNASPTISNNVIASNSASGGGGIYCNSASPIISNNTIASNNASYSGGGIYCSENTSSVILNNKIIGNSSVYSGGGIYCNSASPVISNNTIIGNSALNGGGILCSLGSSPMISNNIVAFNSNGIYESTSGLILKNNCVYNSPGYNYSGISPGENDIQADPKLVAVNFNEVHIQPDSPCIDAGNDSVVQPGWVDIDGQSRIQGVHVDIGADESDGTVWSFTPPVVYVSTSGNDSNDGRSWSTAKRTVQDGIDTASTLGSAEVWVAAGVYTECISLRNFVHVYGGFLGTEVSKDGRNWRANLTVLDGNQGGSVVTASELGFGTSTIDGFTIRNGKATSHGGGGIYCFRASPVISNNTITGNSSTSDGGSGIYCEDASPVISNNTITNNNALPYGNGGGIYCQNASPTISNNVIASNSASGGGGIYCNHASPIISNNTIASNSASDGGGILCSLSSSSMISNNIVAFNSNGIYESTSGLILKNNCVYNSPGYNYNGVLRGANDIQLDPLFVNKNAGDYHLQANSPCIDAGFDIVVQPGWPDMDGQPRIMGPHTDIGADEFVAYRLLSEAKKTADGEWADIRGLVVTATFEGFFYAENPDRTCGIRIAWNNAVVENSIVDVVGVLETTADKERCMRAACVDVAGTSTVAPLGLSDKYVGGGSFSYDPITKAGQPGTEAYQLRKIVDDGYVRLLAEVPGLNNIGLLIKTWGRVVWVGENEFRIDDGSNFDDGNPNEPGIKVVVPNGTLLPSAGEFVFVTGISSCELRDDHVYRLIRVRRQEDIDIRPT